MELFHGDMNAELQVFMRKLQLSLTGLMMLSLENTPLIHVMKVSVKYPKMLLVQEIIGLPMTYQIMIQESEEIFSSKMVKLLERLLGHGLLV